MRAIAFTLFFAVVIVACGQAPVPKQPRATTIELDAALHERLQLGLPTEVELRATGTQVGTCTVMFDLWDERYEVSRSRTELGFAAAAEVALRHCIEVPVTAAIRVRELPSAVQRYPTF